MEEAQQIKDEIPIPLESLLVEPNLISKVTCAICLCLIRKPRQCRNGHLFCAECIGTCIKKHPECPQCRCSLQESELARSNQEDC